MKDRDKTKDQLIHELTALRQQIAELEEIETQHNKVEQALRDCEESFKAIAENAAYGVAIVMSEGTHVYVNRSVTEITGYSIDELLHMNLRNLLLRDEHDRLMQVFRKRLTGEPVPSKHETIIIRKNGTRIPVEITVALATWQGKPANIVFSHNITERKQAEKTLKASEERFRMLVETCPDAIFSIDLEGRILSVNKATCDKTGYSKEDLLAMSIKDLTLPSYIPQFRTRVNRLLKGEVLHDLSEYEVIDRAGQRLWIEAASAPLRKGNEIFGFLSVARDITKRKQMDKMLRQSEGRLLQIIQGSSVPTFVIDKSHLITHWNAACESLTGIATHEVIGTHKHWKAFYSSERPALADLIVDNVSEKEIAEFYDGKSRRSKLIGGAYEAEDFFPHLGEKERWLYFTAAPLRDAEGNIIGAIETLQDITRRKQAEQALQESEEITRVLFSISNAVNTTINLDELYRFIHVSLSQIIDLRNFYICLYERQTQTITFPYAVDEVDEDVFHTLLTLQDIESGALTGRVLRAGRPLLIKKEELLTQVRDQGKKVFGNMPEVWLGVPLKVKNEVIGVMATQSYTDPNRYNKRDLDILLSVSDQVALAIERKQAEGALRRSEEEAKRLAQENATMAEIGRIISSSLNIDEVYERFAEEVSKLIQFDNIVINIINPKENTVTISYVTGIDVPSHRAGDTIPLAGTATGECMRIRSSLLIQIEDIAEATRRFPGLLPNLMAGLRSMIFVPLISKDQVIGVLSLRATKLNAYTEEDLRLAERVGNQIVDAIANAQLFIERKRAEEALRESKEINRVLFSISNAVNTTVNLDELYRFIHASLSQIIGLRNFYISLYDYQTQTITFPYASDEMDVNVFQTRTLQDIESSALTGRVLSTGRPLLIKKEELLTQVRDQGKRVFGNMPEVWLGVPLKVKNEVIGVMATQSYTDSNHYSKRDLDILLSVSDQVALAIERKQAEKALRESEERYRALFESSKDAVYITTREGKIIDANQSMVDLFGYTGEELEKLEACETYVNPDDRLRFQQVIEEKGSVRDFEVRLRKKDGREMDCLITATLRKDNDGNILGYQGVIRDITERKRTEEELAYMATHDLLTSLPNRILFNDRLSVAMAQAQRAHKKLAVMFLDLDRFKEVNDTLGHNAGDRVLCAIGNRLKELLRKIDSVARMGGDEFLLLLPDIDCVKDAISIAQKVLEGFQKPFVVEGHEISITTSIGIAIYPDDGEDVETLVSRADKAMYGAKQREHDTYQPYPQTINGKASE